MGSMSVQHQQQRHQELQESLAVTKQDLEFWSPGASTGPQQQLGTSISVPGWLYPTPPLGCTNCAGLAFSHSNNPPVTPCPVFSSPFPPCSFRSLSFTPPLHFSPSPSTSTGLDLSLPKGPSCRAFSCCRRRRRRRRCSCRRWPPPPVRTSSYPPTPRTTLRLRQWASSRGVQDGLAA